MSNGPLPIFVIVFTSANKYLNCICIILFCIHLKLSEVVITMTRLAILCTSLQWHCIHNVHKIASLLIYYPLCVPHCIFSTEMISEWRGTFDDDLTNDLSINSKCCLHIKIMIFCYNFVFKYFFAWVYSAMIKGNWKFEANVGKISILSNGSSKY